MISENIDRKLEEEREEHVVSEASFRVCICCPLAQQMRAAWDDPEYALERFSVDGHG